MKEIHLVPRLLSLSISSNPVFSNDTEQLQKAASELASAWALMPQLQELDISDTRLNGKALECIADHVTKQIQISDNGFSLQTQSGLVNLRVLNISKNRLTDLDMKALGKIMTKTPRLEALDLTHCRDVSERGLQLLKGRMARGFHIGYENSADIQERLQQFGFQCQDGVYVVAE